MRVLWDEGEATVAQVHRRLDGDKHRALTTIATMLSKMEKKGVVGHRIEGRQFVYRPEVTQEEVARSMVADLTRRVFQGDVAALVSHLLTEQEIDRDDLGRLVELVRREESEQGRHESR